MKYWRGYLVAAIFVAMSWGLLEFARSHWELVDMVYPYVSRLIQNYLADWSSGIGYCLWQLLLLVGAVLLVASVVMMVLWKWNPIQWFGWVLAAVSVVFFLNTAIFDLNQEAGPLAQDVHLQMSDYTLSELETSATYYRDKANALSLQVSRNPDNSLNYPDFETLAAQAGEGFDVQVYQRYRSIFAGSNTPVKTLSWPELFTKQGITGITFGLTGEAAVNPETPTVVMPFVICREMAKRRCIVNEQDAAFAAIMACDANSAPEFQYAAYLMAYRYCYETIASMQSATGQSIAAKLQQGQTTLLTRDLTEYNDSFAAEALYVAEETENGVVRGSVTDMLVSWHIQEYILPAMEEETVIFDPMDESQVDLSGLPNAG